jgi:large subunit ribosomal protein L10
MDNPRPDKVAVVDEVRSRLDEADAVIVTEYRGLKVKDLAALRRSISTLGAEYRIYKNTLVRLAANQSADGFAELVTGPTALTFVQGDAAAVTKALRDFARANPLLVIKGGLLGNSVLGAQATAALADLPSREVLLARLAGALAAPMQSMAGLLAAVPRNFAYGLVALRDERAAGEPSSEAPSASAADAPTSSSEEAPSASSEEAPSASAADAPSASSEEAPSASAADAPSASSEEAPSASSEDAPTSSSEEIPSASSEEDPSASSEEAPSSSSEEAPS